MSGEIPSQIPFPQPPERITLTTGAEEENLIEQATDRFFRAITESVAVHSGNDISAERIDLELNRTFSAAGREVVLPTNDNIRLLAIHGSIVASALNRRDGYNRQQALFANTLTPELAANLSAIPDIPWGTADHDEVDDMTNTYLEGVLDELGLIPRARNLATEITNFALYPFGHFSGQTVVDSPSDMKLTVLTVMDVGIASVAQQKQNDHWKITPFNYLSQREIERMRQRSPEFFESIT